MTPQTTALQKISLIELCFHDGGLKVLVAPSRRSDRNKLPVFSMDLASDSASFDQSRQHLPALEPLLIEMAGMTAQRLSALAGLVDFKSGKLNVVHRQYSQSKSTLFPGGELEEFASPFRFPIHFGLRSVVFDPAMLFAVVGCCSEFVM